MKQNDKQDIYEVSERGNQLRHKVRKWLASGVIASVVIGVLAIYWGNAPLLPTVGYAGLSIFFLIYFEYDVRTRTKANHKGNPDVAEK